MTRDLTYVLSAGMVLLALGCGDSNRESSPTSPEFTNSTGCNLSTAKSLVNSVFSTSSTRQAANRYLQSIQSSGSASLAATNAGFDLFALIAANRPVPPVNGSAFVKAVLSCMDIPTVSSTVDFTRALGPNGGFQVRGGSATDTAAAVSADGAWGLEPPLDLSGTTPVRLTWDQITNLTNSSSNTGNKRFLAYGSPITDPDFVEGYTEEVLVSSIFDWSTIPTATFSPGAVVGTCITDEEDQQFLIQHHATADNGEIIPSATPSFCPSALTRSRARGLGTFAFVRRVLDFFRPQPLLAAALGTRPPGGSIGALSPNAAVNPGQILLAFANKNIDDGRTGQVIKAEGNIISVNVTPAGQTKMDGVLVRLIPTTNLGATVVATGNEARTENGIATFPGLRINKAGGYRLIATLAAFGQNDATGFDFDNVTSDGFNLKQAK
jgi:hypothetical protein